MLHNFIISILRSSKGGNVYTRFHAYIQRSRRFYVIVYWFCETLVEHPTSFVEASQKRRRSIELSKIISKRRCELKASEPVNERSECAIGYFVGFITKEPPGDSVVNPQYSILFNCPFRRSFIVGITERFDPTELFSK